MFVFLVDTGGGIDVCFIDNSDDAQTLQKQLPARVLQAADLKDVDDIQKIGDEYTQVFALDGQQLTLENALVRRVAPDLTHLLEVEMRAARDQRLRDCDIRVLPDYPQTEDERAAWLAYRQALRDLPQQDGFPWNGPDDPTVPWPSAPVE